MASDGVRSGDRERQILCDITYMWNLKNNTNKLLEFFLC